MRDGGAIIRSRTAAALLMVLGVMVLAVPDAARASSHVQLAPQGEDAAATASDDERKVLLQADSVTYDPNTETVVATGNVEAAFDERVLTADSLTYFRETEKVIAEGNVRLVESERIVVFGDRVELEDQLRIGVIESFSALLEDNARLIADQAVRREGNINELIRATYSACNVCDDEGNAKSPLWQIRAFRVIQDEEELTIRYRDVYFEFLGVPVLYLPYLSHADPSVKRKSGFLAPSAGDSERLGFFAEVPYFFALSPYYDLTLKPVFYSETGVLMQGEWRHNLRRGRYNLDGSFIYTDDKDDNNQSTGNKTLTGHIFGSGTFRPSPNWSAEFQVQSVSDDTYLRRYDISNEVDLETFLSFLGVKGRSFVDIRSYYFQGLRTRDDPGLTPRVMPLIRGRYVIEQKQLGRINIEGNALVLQRTEGLDSRRVSLGLDWRREIRTPMGQLITPFASVRADYYNIDDVTPDDSLAFDGERETVFRTLPTAGIDIRWPFVKATSKSFNVVVEPIAQAVIGRNDTMNEKIPNEDSQSFEFDTTNLFRDDKSPGLDLWEGGTRINVGIKGGAYWDDGREVSAMIGRTYRLDDDSPFAVGTGLDTKNSDIVGEFTVRPVQFFSISHRFRLDDETLRFRRNEVAASLDFNRFRGSLRYTQSERQASTTGIPAREEIRMDGRLKVTKNWSAIGRFIRDLESDRQLESLAALEYEDECTIFRITAKRQFFRDRDIRPSDTILFSLVLKTLN